MARAAARVMAAAGHGVVAVASLAVAVGASEAAVVAASVDHQARAALVVQAATVALADHHGATAPSAGPHVSIRNAALPRRRKRRASFRTSTRI